MSTEIKRNLILTEGRLYSVHTQLCTSEETILHLVYMMIRKTQY